MRAFIGVVVVLLALQSIGKLLWLAKGDFPLRKPSVEAFDVVCGFALIVWAVSLLVVNA